MCGCTFRTAAILNHYHTHHIWCTPCGGSARRHTLACHFCGTVDAKQGAHIHGRDLFLPSPECCGAGCFFNLSAHVQDNGMIEYVESKEAKENCSLFCLPFIPMKILSGFGCVPMISAANLLSLSELTT
eukprot:1157797-Pelagomonas_calceolata.AAC.7